MSRLIKFLKLVFLILIVGSSLSIFVLLYNV